MRLALFLAPLSALAATPALAADPAHLDCPLAALNAGQRAAVTETFVRLGGNGEAGSEALRASVRDCAARHGWSDAAANSAVGYHGAALAAALLGERLSAAGVDVAALERLLISDTALLAAFGEGGLANGAMADFVARNEAFIAGMLASLPEARQTETGNFAGFIVSREGLRRMFVRN